MNTIITISKREFTAYFTTPIAYVYLVTFLALINWLFFRGFFLMGQADLRSFFAITPWIFLFFVPAVAMGKWAEERKQGTLELLFTLPIRDRDLIFGKFFGSLGLIVAALLFTLPIALTAELLGNLDWGPVIGGYVGLTFLGGAFLAIGLAISSLTENQIIAFIGGVLACFVLYFLGSPLFSWGSGLIAQAMQYASLATHFESIERGVLDTRDIFYYLSVIGLALFANVKVLESWARK
ncbi:MAG: ABC transporter permease subunit [Deltaproteobacteria bacterium]|nr:ABC transporter permease subunit [Deltaproteobacteria bacterium]